MTDPTRRPRSAQALTAEVLALDPAVELARAGRGYSLRYPVQTTAEDDEMADVNVGLLVRIEAKPGKEEEVAQFLAGAVELAAQEPDTADWFAVRIGPGTFGVFDTFADDAGRQAHLNGKIAEALMGAVGELVEQPVIEPVDVLARKD